MTLSWPFARGQGYLLAVSGLAVLALLAGLLGYWVPGVAWGLAGLAAAFLFRLALQPASVTAWTPAAGAALVLTAELAYWSHEVDEGGWIKPWRRLVQVVLVAVGAGAITELVLDLSLAAPITGLWVVVAGAAAAALAPAVLLRVGRR